MYFMFCGHNIVCLGTKYIRIHWFSLFMATLNQDYIFYTLFSYCWLIGDFHELIALKKKKYFILSQFPFTWSLYLCKQSPERSNWKMYVHAIYLIWESLISTQIHQYYLAILFYWGHGQISSGSSNFIGR